MNAIRTREIIQVIERLKAHYPQYLQSEPEVGDPFRILIGCVLSQRTRDANASRAAEALFNVVGTPEGILELGELRLRDLIRCSGFYNQKAKNILAICEALIEHYDGAVPRERYALIGLPGVGPKTSDIVLSYAFDIPAIAVDVHVSKVAKRLGLVERKAGPEEVKDALESLVPCEMYRFVDRSFVRHGKEICLSRNPKCDLCTLINFCKYSEKAYSRIV